MSKHFQRFLILSVISLCIFSSTAFAEKPVQIALFNPIQLFSEDESIKGVRLNLIYGKNAALTGIDFGFVNHLTAPSLGIQYSFLANISDSDFTGYQHGFISITKGSLFGLQSGAYNYSKNATGIQWGFINVANRMEGVQFGFINYTVSMKGLQIGFANVIRQGGVLPVLPIINFSF
ncbi:MAG: hypothetical protein P9X24_13020 [Candidatus Hatepunaea meridiana]|nr:hypothetical protein [Candidatus Hatepunaea meridiana]